MHDQPRYEPLEATDFFVDGRASRPLVEGTAPRGFLREDAHLFTGKLGEDFVREFPFPVHDAVLARGRERYEIFCTPCHGRPEPSEQHPTTRRSTWIGVPVTMIRMVDRRGCKFL